MTKKKDLPAFGDNSKALLHQHVEFIEAEKAKIIKSNGKIKKRLNEAKKDGYLKTSVRDTIKERGLSEAQKQSRTEIKEATEHYNELCADLPLFDYQAQKAA